MLQTSRPLQSNRSLFPMTFPPRFDRPDDVRWCTSFGATRQRRWLVCSPWRVAADIGCLLFVFASGRRFAKCLRVQISQQTVDLHIPDEITDVFDLLDSVVRKFYAGKFFLDQYQQLKLIEGIKVQIVSEVHLICNSFGINT